MRRLTALAMFVSLYSVGLYAETQTDSRRIQELHPKAAAAIERGDLPTAIALLTECRALARTPFEIALMSSELGTTLFRANQLGEARKWLEQADEVWVSTNEDYAHYARTSVVLAEVYRCLGRYIQSEQLLRQVLSRAPSVEHASADDTEAHALALDDLADMMREEGRSTESRQLLNQATALPGVSWRRELDVTLGLAELDRDAHNWEESIAEWNRIAQIGRDHNDLSVQALVDRGLGETWLDRGDAARAEPLLKNALGAFQQTAAPNNLQIASTLTSMAQLYIGENKFALAEEALSKALQTDEKVLGESHPQVGVILEMLGDTRSRLNNIETARENVNRAITILSAAFGERSATCAAALGTLGVIEQRAHNFVRAVAVYERSLAAFANSGPDISGFKLAVMRRYAEVLKATHRNHDAGTVLAQIKAFQVPMSLTQ